MLRNKIVLCVTTVLLFSCNNKKQVQPIAQSYPVVEVQQRDVEGFYTFPTEIEGKNNVMVRPKISGYIKKSFVDEGDFVKAGQPLFELETNVQSQNASSSKAQIGAANASIKAAEANVKTAQVEVDRLIPLVEKGIISSVQLETAKANLAKAQSQVSQAKANAEVAKAGYKGVNENIKFATVTSLIAGVVGKINYGIGDLVGPNDPKPITNVSDVSEIEAYMTLNEKQYINFFEKVPGNNLKEKMAKVPPITLVLATGNDYSEKGKVVASTGQTDPGTGTIRFRIQFPNPKGMLNNGSTGKIKIPHLYSKALVIPESATFEQQGFVYAYKVVNDTARLVTIEIMDRVNNLAIIKSGLEINDKVVVSGVGNLKNNTPIKPQKTNMDSLVNSIKPIK